MTWATWLTTAVALGAVYAALGLAVTAVTQVTRTLHLAIGPIVVVAALVQAALVVLGQPAAVGLAAGAAVAVLASAALQPLVLSRHPDPTSRLVGLLVAGGVLELLTARLLGGTTRRLPPLVGDDEIVAALVVGVAVAAVLGGALRWSRWGRRLRLVGGSPAAAERVGVSPARVRVSALVVAGLVAALAAALISPIGFVGVGQGLGLTVRGVAAAMVLGRADARRAVAGGLLLGAVEAGALATLPAVGTDLVLAIAVVAALVAVRPERAQGWGRVW